MDELILFPSTNQSDFVIDHFIAAAIEAFQNTDMEQVQIKTNVGYTYTPAINDFSELLTDPDYRTFKAYLSEHPVVRLEQGLIIAHSKQRIDKEGISKTKTKKCSFTLTLHENGSHYRLKISDEIKEGVKFNVRVLEAFARRFEIVEPFAVNQPVISSLGKELISSLKEIQETIGRLSMQPIGGQLSRQIKEQAAAVSSMPVSDNAGSIRSLDGTDQSIIAQAPDKASLTEIKFNEDSLEKARTIVTEVVKEAGIDLGINVHHSKQAEKIRHAGMEPGKEERSVRPESWTWKLLSGSTWISSMLFLVMCILLSTIHQKFEWQLLLPWAGFLIVYSVLQIAHRSRKMK